MPIAPLVLPSDLDAYQAGDAQTYIDAATALVRAYCGWHVAPSLTETVTLDGSGSGLLLLPSLHVADVVSVTEDGTELTADDYTWSASGWLRKSTGWTCADRAMVVTFTHGYDAAPDVAAVVMAAASRGQVSPRGEVRQQMGPFATSYSQAAGFNQAAGLTLLEPERAVLDRYRLPGRP